jgi:hypothetical protein
MQEMKQYKLSEIALFTLLAVTLVLFVGCVATKSDVHYSGVNNSQLRQIERGKTTKDWLVTALGEPTEQSMTEEGTEILRYKCIEKRDNQFVLFPPPIVIDDKKEIEHTVVFKLKDGIVQRYWKER